MSRCVDLDEKVTAQFYNQECEEWTMQTVTIEDVLDSVCDEYTVLPSAQPERMRGRWIYVNGHTVINCSACYHCSWSLPFEDTVKRFKFCPNCGAEMEVSE